MAHRLLGKTAIRPSLMAAAMMLSMGVAQAQANGASDADKKFLDDTAQDSNFEIKSGELALKKNSGADVKAYANMVIRDHNALLERVKHVDEEAGVKPQGTDTMSVGDRARYAELDVLTGKTFDDAYIKGLVKGNIESVNAGKSEASSSTFAPVKALAVHRVALDGKHTRAADALARTHHVDANQ